MCKGRQEEAQKAKTKKEKIVRTLSTKKGGEEKIKGEKSKEEERGAEKHAESFKYIKKK
jgi:hypothetical protein